MGQAALQYVRRGWPVFPCRERDGEPYSYTDKKTGNRITKTPRAKQPYVGNGFKDATRDEQRVTTWWRQHPDAMIGLPQGVNGLFVLDFDPRPVECFDPITGEVEIGEDGQPVMRMLGLDELKAELEAQMGCALPRSVTGMTPSGGVHVYFRQPGDGGALIRNRGNLPDHVDVRGDGGYTIGQPSRVVQAANSAEGEYRWIRGDWRSDADFAEAPAALIEILRSKKARASVERPAAPSPAAESARPARVAADVDDDLRKYAMSALDGECQAIRRAASGQRNAQLNESAFKVATLVAAGILDEAIARSSVESAARANPGHDDDAQLIATINSGWTAGIGQPRDLGEIAAAAKSRREKRAASRASSRPRPPSSDDDGQPSSHAGGSGGKDAGNGREGRGAGDLTRECAFLPQTDLGNLERFLKRHGRDFLFVEAWGWLAWDGRRWNRDMAMALLGRAVQDTMRAIQDEAEFIAASGVPFPPEGGFPADDDSGDRDEDDDLFDHSASGKARRKRKNLEWHLQRQLARRTKGEGDRLDSIVQIKSSGEPVLYSQKVATWGRTSESAGHVNCIAKLAEARLARATDVFDADPLLVNVQNGTLVFHRPENGEPARVELRKHRRRDLNTKVAMVEYDAGASCAKFDAFLAEVQPDPEMRAFLDVWAGYSMTGLSDAQKMAIFYGQGSNGKGVWINTVAHILGDYAWAAGIETFMDQGKYRKGSDASPDLAALSGRRFVYANEPENGAKFSDGLIKSMTSDEPIGGVRELMKPPFQLLVTFTNTVSANVRPGIGTDHGIQRRVQIVPWDVIIPTERADPRLKDKLKAEASGILNRMVAGALAYLSGGLPVPSAIKEATASYLAENDILGQFITLCVHPLPGETVGATALHEVFAGWQTWAQLLPASGKPWSPKHLAGQMEKKGFKKVKSSTMQWQDIGLQFERFDFVDEGGKAVERALPPPRYSSDPPTPIDEDDDDVMPA